MEHKATSRILISVGNSRNLERSISIAYADMHLSFIWYNRSSMKKKRKVKTCGFYACAPGSATVTSPTATYVTVIAASHNGHEFGFVFHYFVKKHICLQVLALVLSYITNRVGYFHWQTSDIVLQYNMVLQYNIHNFKIDSSISFWQKKNVNVRNFISNSF